MRARVLTVFCVLALAVAPIAAAPDTSVTGRILDQSGLPLPGVAVAVSAEGIAARAAVADGTGHFQFDLPPGRYTLTAELSGFTPIQRALVVGADPVALEFTMTVAVSEQVIVTAVPEPIIGAPSAAAAASLPRDVIQSAMLPNNTFDDALPMLPNVVRGPDGLISVAGARAPQGQMLVNGLGQTDPVLGEPDIQAAASIRSRR